MASKENFEEVLIRTKPVRMLISLNKKDKTRYASILAKEIDCTYSHTVRTLQQFKKNGLIEFKTIGRLKEINLTEKGRRLADAFETAINVMRT